MNIKKLSKTKTALLVLAIGLLLAAGVIVFRSKAPYHGPYADVASFASGYYNALIQKDYDTALGLLHRSPDTMFDDEFLLTGLQNSPPIYYRVNSVKKLSDGIFRFLYKGIIIKHNKTEPTYTKTSLFLCEKRRFFMARTEKGVVTTI